jgi:hypothetical protein
VKNPDFRESVELIRRAINENVIDPTPDTIRRWQFGDIDKYQSIFDSMTAQWRSTVEKSPWLYQQQSWQLPTTRRYVQSRHPVSGKLTQPNASLSWMAEIARFVVPYGSVGIIKSFEQYVAQGETVYTTSAHWGNPFPLSSSISWFFRLSHIHLLGNPWINVSGLSAIPDYLPGISYDDFARSDDLWFPACSSSSSNIHLPIPGGQFLRLIVLVGTSQTPVSISAKLAGTVQSEMSSDAQFTVRTSW